MSTDKTQADVQPGGRVRLGDALSEAARRVLSEVDSRESDSCISGAAYAALKSALSAQPSPGGQGADLAPRIRGIAGLVEVARPHEAIKLRDIADELAARQPVGELHLPPDGFYKIVYDDAEVPDESFARSGALDAALRRFEQISNKWNAHLFVRFANNTRDCTVPNATPAQAVDLGQFRQAVHDQYELAKQERDAERISEDSLIWHAARRDRLLAMIGGQAVGK